MKKTSTADHWKDYWQREDHQPLVVHHELIEGITSLIDVRGRKVLEIGAGMGGDSIRLGEMGADVYALDFTEEALREVARNARLRKVTVHQVKADARRIPFPKDHFDVVFHQGFLEHFTDPKALLKEQVRVLKPGGLLLVDVPQRYTTYTLKKHLAMLRGRWFTGWEREFSVRELTALMKSSNLHIEKTYGWGYYGKLHTLRNLKLGFWYGNLWHAIERSPVSLYLYWCIGAVGRKL